VINPIINASKRLYHTATVALIICCLFLSACQSTAPVVVEAPVEEQTQEPTPTILSPADRQNYRHAQENLNGDKTAIDRARSSLKQLSKRHRQHFGIKLNLATAYYRQQQWDEAEKYCNQAMAINNTHPQVHNLKGLIAVEKRGIPLAEREYLIALTLDPDYANAHYNLALLYDIYYQDINKAYLHYLKYLNLVPDDEAVKGWVERLKYSVDQS